MLNGSENNVGSSIQCVKRDTELVILLGLLILVLMMIAGKKGLLTIVTVGINIVIFTAGFLKSGDDADVVAICNKMVIFFAVVTLIGLNGLHRKTWAALLSTLCILAMIMGIFDAVISHTAELDYSTMEYLFQCLPNLQLPDRKNLQCHRCHHHHRDVPNLNQLQY